MSKLTQEEFAEIDNRVFNFGLIQKTLSTLNKDNIDEIYENLIQYDNTHLKFIAYTILEICEIRVNMDEEYGKLFHKLIIKEGNYNEMIDLILAKSSPILRIVVDLGGIPISEIETRQLKHYQCFSGIFADIPLPKVKYNDEEIEITKDLIYHKYKEGTIERAIYDNHTKEDISQLLKNSGKKWSDKIIKSPFDNYKEDEIPIIAQFAFHCNSKNAIKLFLPKVFPYPNQCDSMKYAIMSGGKEGIEALNILGCSLDDKFYESSKYLNCFALEKCEEKDEIEGTIVYNNIYTVYKYRDDVNDQVFDPIVYDLIDHPILNDVTKWLLCVHGVSLYTGSKYLSYSVNNDNKVITDFIFNQFPKVNSFLLECMSDSSDDDDNDD